METNGFVVESGGGVKAKTYVRTGSAILGGPRSPRSSILKTSKPLSLRPRVPAFALSPQEGHAYLVKCASDAISGAVPVTGTAATAVRTFSSRTIGVQKN